MQAIKLVEEMIGKNKRIFEIPPYQRNYAWDKNNCNQLLNDILKASKINKTHFMGTILYVNYDNNSRLDTCLVIDGQQRLTTIMILLKVLYNIAIEFQNNEIAFEIEDLLFNKFCDEKYKIKLKPIKKDEEQIINIFKGNLDNIDKTSNIYKNYKTLTNLLKEKLENTTLEKIFDGIKLLMIVEITLENGKDDAQAIFESINSTGKSLTTTDKLRNFLLMNSETIEEQNNIYYDLWQPLEESLGEEELEKYFYNYLIMKQNKYIKDIELYEKYKEFVHNSHLTRTDALNDLLYYSKFYKLLLGTSTKYSEDLSNICKTFKEFRHNTIYSFLMNICKDHDRKIITDNDLKNILTLFSNYALRRLVNNIPSSSLRRFYTNLYDKIFKNEENKKHYFDAIVTYLCTLNTNDKFPNDIVFRNALENENIYNKNMLTKFLLENIENNASKEIVDFTELTIEHIMPQTLNNSWKEMLGENYEIIHEKYVNTLGNLSMTGYNSEYSNAKYEIKKQKIEQFNSKLTVLNKEIYENDKWNESIIELRAKRLSSEILKLYPMPTNIRDIEFNIQMEYTLEEIVENDYNVEDNTLKLDSYKFFKTSKITRYKDLLMNVLSELYELDGSILEKLAKENFTFKNGQKALITYSKDMLRTPAELKNGVYIETNHSSNTIFKVIKTFLEKYDIDLDDIIITYVKNE